MYVCLMERYFILSYVASFVGSIQQYNAWSIWMWRYLILFLFWFRLFICTVRLLFHSFLERERVVRSNLDVEGRGGKKKLDLDGQGWWGVLKIRQFSLTSYVYCPYPYTPTAIIKWVFQKLIDILVTLHLVNHKLCSVVI